jgi:hypothetical protein
MWKWILRKEVMSTELKWKRSVSCSVLGFSTSVFITSELKSSDMWCSVIEWVVSSIWGDLCWLHHQGPALACLIYEDEGSMIFCVVTNHSQNHTQTHIPENLQVQQRQSKDIISHRVLAVIYGKPMNGLRWKVFLFHTANRQHVFGCICNHHQGVLKNTNKTYKRLCFLVFFETPWGWSWMLPKPVGD